MTKTVPMCIVYDSLVCCYVLNYRHVFLLQGSVQRGETMYSPADGAAVRRQDRRRSQVHLQSRTKHVRLVGQRRFSCILYSGGSV